MKKLIFLLLLLPLISLSQEGGLRSLKTKSAKVTFLDLAGNGNKLIGIDNNGKAKSISVDGVTITLEGDTLKASPQYTLPAASTTVLGGVKIDGTSITISDGVISSENQYKSAQILNSSTNLTVDYSLGSNAVLTMTGNITNLTFTNIPDGGYGDIYVIQNSTGGYGITNIIHAGLTSSYPDPDGDNVANKPVAANINSLATRKTTISYHRVGSYLLITYGNYAQ